MNEYTLKLSVKDLETIGFALQELPFKTSAGVLNTIQLQINKQESETKDEKTEERSAKPRENAKA